jgi:hypothetical protein
MMTQSDALEAVVAALRRRSERTLLQRRITYVLGEIETLLAMGWSMTELAGHLAIEGVTQRDGQSLTSGHFAVMVTRARAKLRAGARRQARSTHPAPIDRPTLPNVRQSEPASGGSGIAINLAKIAEKSGRRAAQQEREAATERNIGVTLDAMFGRSQTDAPRSAIKAKASSSSALKRPRPRQAR